MPVTLDKNNRRIHLNGRLSSENSQDLIDYLLDLESIEERDDINLYINSYGGYVHEFLAVYDVIQSLKCEVNTIGIGKCMSAGLSLLMCGTGVRKAYKNTRLMLHSIQGSYSYKSIVDNDINHKENLKLQEIMEDITAKHTKQSVDKIHEDMKRDYFMSAEEGKKYGLIDKVM